MKRKYDIDELEKMAEEFLNDGEQDAWETGKLGRNVKHMRVAPEREIKKFLNAVKRQRS